MPVGLVDRVDLGALTGPLADASRKRRRGRQAWRGRAPPTCGMLPPMKRPLLGLVFAAASAAAVVPAPALADQAAAHADVPPDESFSEYVPGASRLEGRLLAPCCWDSSRQTLDIHGSPIANELRREIRTRLKAGESPDTIEADLVRRFSPKILAVPPGSPLPRLGPLLVAGLAVGLVVAGRTVSRWRKRGIEQASTGAKAAPDEWDRKLDAELEEPE